MAVTMATTCAIGRVIPATIGNIPSHVLNLSVSHTPPSPGLLPTFPGGKKDTGRTKYGH